MRVGPSRISMEREDDRLHSFSRGVGRTFDCKRVKIKMGLAIRQTRESSSIRIHISFLRVILLHLMSPIIFYTCSSLRVCIRATPTTSLNHFPS
jgi:hypothetical protein